MFDSRRDLRHLSRPLPPVDWQIGRCLDPQPQSAAGIAPPLNLDELQLWQRMEVHQSELKERFSRLEDLILQSCIQHRDVSHHSTGSKLGGPKNLSKSNGQSCETEDKALLSTALDEELRSDSCEAVADCIAESDQTVSTGIVKNEQQSCIPADIIFAAESQQLGSTALASSASSALEPELIVKKPRLSTISQVSAAVPLARGVGSVRKTISGVVKTMTRSSLGTTRYEDNCYAAVVGDHRFDHACAFLIIASSLLVGMEVQYVTDENEGIMTAFGYTFVGLFSIELIVRIKARGVKRYFCGQDQGWSFFDCFCVASSYMELIVSSVLPEDGSGSFLLVVRTLRVVRIARIIRVIRFLSKLRMMVYTMLGAMNMLGWAVLLLAMIMYMFSVCFTEAAKPLLSGAQDVSHSDDPEKIIALGKDHFEDLYVSMLTLFEAITGGVSWHEPLRVLKELSLLYVIMFVAYICVTCLTILNVITGLCCDYAIQYAVADRADVIKQQIGLKDKWKHQFAQMFRVIDEDDSGEVSADELKAHLEEEDFQAYLNHLNISVDDAYELLEFLDRDGDGLISLDEFVSGCMRVKGQAKTIDILKIVRDCEFMRKLLESSTGQPLELSAVRKQGGV